MMPFGHLPPELSLLWESDDEHQALAPSSVLLGTLFRDWRPATAPARRALRECYEQVRPLGETERAWLETLTLWIGLASVPGEDAVPWIAAVEDLSAD